MQQIADWLEKLGMSEYAQRFADNDIDASVLPHVTDQSLKELGVSLGHRLKILAAVKELGGPTPAPPQSAAPTETKPQDTAERHQISLEALGLCAAFYEPDLGADPDSPFARDASDKLVRRSFWRDMSDRTLVMVMVNGIGAHLTNDVGRQN